MAQPHALVEQRLLETERAADDEGDQVVAPQWRDVGGLVDQLTVAPDAVARQVAADVDVLAERGQRRLAGVAHGQQRAGLGVALAVAQEIVRPVTRQDHDVALDVAIGQAAGVRSPRAGPEGSTPL
jgi:hypothetical protein